MNRHIRWLAPEVRKGAEERLIDPPPGGAALRGLDTADRIWDGELPSKGFNRAGRVA